MNLSSSLGSSQVVRSLGWMSMPLVLDCMGAGGRPSTFVVAVLKALIHAGFTSLTMAFATPPLFGTNRGEISVYRANDSRVLGVFQHSGGSSPSPYSASMQPYDTLHQLICLETLGEAGKVIRDVAERQP